MQKLNSDCGKFSGDAGPAADRVVPFDVSIAILDHIPDSRLVLLSNCGHWPPFEKPAEWTAQVLAFLQGY
jgi:2-hydroxy-6-oxonona-2,4-dienedioate hydrolase